MSTTTPATTVDSVEPSVPAVQQPLPLGLVLPVVGSSSQPRA